MVKNYEITEIGNYSLKEPLSIYIEKYEDSFVGKVQGTRLEAFGTVEKILETLKSELRYLVDHYIDGDSRVHPLNSHLTSLVYFIKCRIQKK